MDPAILSIIVDGVGYSFGDGSLVQRGGKGPKVGGRFFYYYTAMQDYERDIERRKRARRARPVEEPEPVAEEPRFSQAQIKAGHATWTVLLSEV